MVTMLSLPEVQIDIRPLDRFCVFTMHNMTTDTFGVGVIARPWSVPRPVYGWQRPRVWEVEMVQVCCGACDRILSIPLDAAMVDSVAPCPCGEGADLAFHRRHAS